MVLVWPQVGGTVLTLHLPTHPPHPPLTPPLTPAGASCLAPGWRHSSHASLTHAPTTTTHPSPSPLPCRRLGDNQLTGTIPETWGSAGSFPHLTALALDNNTLAGTLPRLWSRPNVMRFLQEL